LECLEDAMFPDRDGTVPTLTTETTPPPTPAKSLSPAEAVRVVREAARAVCGWKELKALVDALAED
jgi:hypothetical protein